MSQFNLLKNVNSFDNYNKFTLKVKNEKLNSKALFNAPTILGLRKCLSFEVEYFVKYKENGGAIKILQAITELPPSREWHILGMGVVLLIHSWIEKIKSQLISHTSHWWSFLQILLQFLQRINSKSTTLNEIIIEKTAECLLDLAAQSLLNVNQTREILNCFNGFGASREIRLAWKEKLDKYFVKLSEVMACCGDIGTQFAILQTLVRWLIPREDQTVCMQAAEKWFPTTLYSEEAIKIFLSSSWFYFFKDARCFLNAHNKNGDSILSLNVLKFAIGSITLIDKTGGSLYFVDLNCGSKSITMLLSSKILAMLGSSSSGLSVLTISEDNTNKITMQRYATNITIMITLLDPLKVYPADALQDNCDVTIEVNPESDAAKVEKVLKDIFNFKYQNILRGRRAKLTINKKTLQRKLSSDVESLRSAALTSLPMDIKRGRRAKLTLYKKPLPRKLSSDVVSSRPSVSTASVAMDQFNKRRTKQALLTLSDVAEVTEGERESVSIRSQKALELQDCGHKQTHEDALSPIIHCSNHSNSSILALANDSAICIPKNNAFESLTSKQGDQIVDILAQEALNSQNNNNSKINDIENSQCNQISLNSNNKKPSVITKTSRDKVSHLNKTPVSSESDESDTQAGDVQKKEWCSEKQTDIVEKFFSEHFAENKISCRINQTLTRQINRIGSESSDDLGISPLIVYTNNKIDANECQNDVIDEDCANVNKCTEHNEDLFVKNKVTGVAYQKSPNPDISDANENLAKSVESNKGKILKTYRNKKKVNINFSNNEIDANECQNDVIDEDCANVNKCTEHNEDLFVKNKVTEVAYQKSPNPDISDANENLAKSVESNKGKILKTYRNKKKVNVNKSKKQLLRITGKKPLIGNTNNERKSLEIDNDLYDIPLIQRKKKLCSGKEIKKPNVVQIPDSNVTPYQDVESIKRKRKLYSEKENKKAKLVQITDSNITSCIDVQSRRRSLQKELNKSTGLDETAIIPSTTKDFDIFVSLDKNRDYIEEKSPIKRNTRNKNPITYDFLNNSDDSFEIRKKSSKDRRRYSQRKITEASNSNKNNKNRKLRNFLANKGKPIRKPLRKDIIDERMRDARDILNTSLIIEATNNDIPEPKALLNTKPGIVDVDSKKRKQIPYKRINRFGIKEKNTSEGNRPGSKTDSDNLSDLVVEKVPIQESCRSKKSCREFISPIEYNDIMKIVNSIKDLKNNRSSPKDNEKQKTFTLQYEIENEPRTEVEAQGEPNDEDEIINSSVIDTRVLYNKKNNKNKKQKITKKTITTQALLHEPRMTVKRVNTIGPKPADPKTKRPFTNKFNSPEIRIIDSFNISPSIEQQSPRMPVERSSYEEINRLQSTIDISTNKGQTSEPLVVEEEVLNEKSPKTIHNIEIPKNNLRQNSDSNNNNDFVNVGERLGNKSMGVPKASTNGADETDWFQYNERDDIAGQNDTFGMIEQIIEKMDTSTEKIISESSKKVAEAFEDAKSRLENLNRKHSEFTERTYDDMKRFCSSLNRSFDETIGHTIEDLRNETSTMIATNTENLRCNGVRFKNDLLAVQDLLRRRKKD